MPSRFYNVWYADFANFEMKLVFIFLKDLAYRKNVFLVYISNHEYSNNFMVIYMSEIQNIAFKLAKNYQASSNRSNFDVDLMMFGL